MVTTPRLLEVDGRQVAVYTLAEGQNDETVVVCHAAPGSGAFDPDPEATAARGVRLLSVDRAGYGASDPPTDWASVGRAADELAGVLDQLQTGAVGVAGWSAGGRVALALAARRPDLVQRVVVLATPAPNDQVEWIPPEQNAMLESMRGQPPQQVHEQLGGMFQQLIPSDPADALGLISGGEADAAIAGPTSVRERLAQMLAVAFRQGAIGMAADVAGYTLQPWGFEPKEVRAKTLLLYGADDQAIGPRHGRWWQSQLPDARLETVPSAGHLVVIPMWARALSHLAPR